MHFHPRGLGAILSCLKELVALGGDLKLCGLQPIVQRTFERARMTPIIEIYPTCDEAVASYA